MRLLLSKLYILGVIALMLSFPACDGVLSNIYDDSKTDNTKEYGFVEISKDNNLGLIYINTSSYTKWTYINLRSLAIDTLEISDNMIEPLKWDFAIHRYDTKTNEGAVLETRFTGLSTLKNNGKLPEGSFVKDIWTEKKIIIDMSQMMEGTLRYTNSFYNSELSKWLNVDTSSMPPNYNPSNKVYILKLKDGTIAAIRLRNFMNAANIKGYMTIEYIYPLEF